MIDINTLKEYYRSSFPGETKKSTDFFFDKHFNQNDYFELIEDDTVVALCLRVHWIDIVIETKKYEVPFIIGLYTIPKYRRMGKMRALMATIESIARLKGSPIMILQAYDYKIYESTFNNYWKSNLYQLGDYKQVPNKDLPLVEINAKKLKSIYDVFTKKLNLYKARSVKDFELLIEQCAIYGDVILASENAYLIYNDHDNTIIEFVFNDGLEAMHLVSKTIVDKVVLTDLQYFTLAPYMDLKRLKGMYVMAAKILDKSVVIPELFNRANVWIHEEL